MILYRLLLFSAAMKMALLKSAALSFSQEIISTSINNVCVKNSVEVITIDIDSYINDDYLQIDKIIVKISNPEKAQLIENEIKKQLGYEVIVN